MTAHSTTRALFASYNGPLYQVKRQSDGKTLDIGLVRPPRADAGGYADAAAQDAFCANTICVINRIYDQSGKGNHLYQAPPGPSFPGPAKGAFDTLPIADMAPITIGGHKAYGVYIMPGMGFRNNDATGLAINDEPEGIYYVVDGTHYDSGCCFDYGNCLDERPRGGHRHHGNHLLRHLHRLGQRQRPRPVDHVRHGGRPVLRIQREAEPPSRPSIPGGS